MQNMIKKTFGGLSTQYYLRHLFFGAILSGLVIMMTLNGQSTLTLGTISLLLINTLLYPYARFVYESIIHFIMGDNIFFINALVMLIVKFITMVLCWSFAIFIAPIGLAYLYYHHTKAAH
ncbi:hypothetical protein BFW38_08730 [Terasakiispira papahanaumokuakeensis]|uniref:Uncharacterized protein n=1 Tax=Terasakiispira papahanaumokuakeensis TaxID=197479 RepID=A0A1E2V9W4_9GAMM|nr:hypothetical protein [Terasakiispira papahanaumokuakeensis]ODC03616.1 hypothetical protein BFW38_08730 [Terasakiispira papahanaumokuakeensis]